jgi:hypothetical protein
LRHITKWESTPAGQEIGGEAAFTEYGWQVPLDSFERPRQPARDGSKPRTLPPQNALAPPVSGAKRIRKAQYFTQNPRKVHPQLESKFRAPYRWPARFVASCATSLRQFARSSRGP